MATDGGNAGAKSRAGRFVSRQSQSEQGGGGRFEAPAPGSTWQRRLERFRRSVWAPVVTKALGILAGMVALASIGASSIARGSGQALPSATASGPAEKVRDPQVHAAQMLGGAHPEPVESPADPGAPESPDAAAPDAGASGGSSSSGLTPDGKVILNLATIEDLLKLPGVGQKRAQAILDLRQKLGGRFRKVTDLLRVKGIGVKSLAKLKDKMVLDPPPPAPPS
jgi:competence protein ComEA